MTQRDATQRVKRKDPTRPVMIIIVVAVLFVFSTLMYKSLSGRNEYRAEQAAQEKEWERVHPTVVPSGAASTPTAESAATDTARPASAP